MSGDGDGPGDAGTPPDVSPVAVAVDPRMRSRRIAVRRTAGRKRLKKVTLALGLVALLVVALAASQSPLLDVDRVLVSGTGHTAEAAVRRESGVDIGDSLVSVDPEAVSDRVEALPWVAEAKVSRAWPSTVRIQVIEREATVLVQVTEDRAALVDDEGRVLSIEAHPADESAPGGEAPLVLTGIGGRVAEGERLPAEARDALSVATAVRARMPGVVVSVSTSLDAALAEGGEIRFGSTEQLDIKVTAAKTVLADVDLACLETLDVRVPGSPALTRNQTCS
ncbi:MAG TPA: FtsQ-type POTRA domain-containing protein [Acidimicrobiales bacterium]|nr:FtsQ-type POTRA domain-containing protein [Acidimicrobiales bacterium]